MTDKFFEGLIGPYYIVKDIVTLIWKGILNVGAKCENKYCREKINKIADEKVSDKIKQDELKRLNTVYNVLEIITKEKAKVGTKTDNIDSFKDVKSKLKGIIADGYSFSDTNYDTSTYAIHNRILCTVLTSFFLVNDAYNLTMAHSKGDQKTSNDVAKNRAVQEASRLTFAVYLMNIIHNPLSSTITPPIPEHLLLQQ